MTLLVAAAIYGGFAALTWFFHLLPAGLTAVLGAVLIAWHGSLQHETIHGHPFDSPLLNTVLGAVPLSLWIPYPIYRSTHLYHHGFEGRILTDPWQDPESFYLVPGALARATPLGRALRRANTTLMGRMLFGPLITVGTFWWSEARKLAAGDRLAWRIWLMHTAGVAIVLGWVVGVCRIPLSAYLVLFVYPGTSLSLLRSFAEHRANADPAQRTAVVEANPVIATIFLYNNIHVVHHAQPSLPWYQIPAVWRAMKGCGEDAPARSAGIVYPDGYLEILRRFAFRPVIEVEYPLTRDAGAARDTPLAHASR